MKQSQQVYYNSASLIDLENKPREDTRLDFIDISKGLGIILVVCSHVYYQLMSWALPCFIPLFFIVSGYCTLHPVNIGKKIKNLILPYVFFSFLLIIVYFDFKPINFIGLLYSRWCLFPLNVEPNIFFLRIGNGPLWFLTCMFVAFVFYKFIQSSNKPWHLAILYILITYILSFLPILLPWSIDTAFLMALFIFVGSYIREKKILDSLSLFVTILLIIIYCVLALLSGRVNLSVRLYGTSLFLLFPAAVIGSILLMKFSAIIDGTIIGNVLKRFGFYSLPIFCIHLPIIHLSRRFISTLFVSLHPVISSLLIVVLVIAVTYPMALIFYKLLKIIKLLF